MGYLSFAVVISVASFTLFGTKLNEASAEPQTEKIGGKGYFTVALIFVSYD